MSKVMVPELCEAYMKLESADYSIKLKTDAVRNADVKLKDEDSGLFER